MPTIPSSKALTLTKDGIDILNVIRNSASTNYQDYVPVAERDTTHLRQIGAILMDNQPLMNEFLHTLVNRIAQVIITSKTFDNKYKMFKRGVIELGEVIEELYVNIAKPHSYDWESPAWHMLKREMPDVRSAFHVMNYQKFYKVTINRDLLRPAFLSFDGIDSLIAKIVDSLYSAEEYDEFLTMKYLMAYKIVTGQIKAITIDEVQADNMGAITADLKTESALLTYASTDNNIAGVLNWSNRGDQIMIVTERFNALADVNVLASAFNLPYVDFLNNRVTIDSFASLDVPRLDELLGENDNYHHFTDEELTQLESVAALVVDKSFFMIFDNMRQFTEFYNGELLAWNYWLHTWKTFSTSPFAPALMFTTSENTVTGITITPDTASASKGQMVIFTAQTTGQGFANKGVKWSTNSKLSKISSVGALTISPDEELTSIQVTATSVSNPSVTATATVNITTSRSKIC